MARNPKNRPQAARTRQPGAFDAPDAMRASNASFAPPQGQGQPAMGGMAGPGAGLIKMLQKVLDGDADALEEAAEEAANVGLVPPERPLVEGILEEMKANVEKQTPGRNGGRGVEVGRQRQKRGGPGPEFTDEIGSAILGGGGRSGGGQGTRRTDR